MAVGFQNVAEENVQYASTCDGDDIYKGKLRDPVTDGSCAWTQYFDPNQVTPAVACTTGVWVNYTWWDQNGNSDADMKLCYNGGCTFSLSTFGY